MDKTSRGYAEKLAYEKYPKSKQPIGVPSTRMEELIAKLNSC